MQCYFETNNFIPKSQSGFRKGKSCTDNLTALTLDVQSAFIKKKDVIAAFLDVQGAFPNVNIDILLRKIANARCPKKIVSIF